MTTRVSVKLEDLHPQNEVEVLVLHEETGIPHSSYVLKNAGDSVDVYVYKGQEILVREI